MEKNENVNARILGNFDGHKEAQELRKGLDIVIDWVGLTILSQPWWFDISAA